MFISNGIVDLNIFIIMVYKEIDLYNKDNKEHPLYILFYICDEPAIKKLIQIKGHGGLAPCNFCYMHGSYVNGNKIFHYPIDTLYTFIDSKGLGRKRNYESHRKFVEDLEKDPTIIDDYGITGYSSLNIYNVSGIIDMASCEWLHSFSLNLILEFLELVIYEVSKNF